MAKPVVHVITKYFYPVTAGIEVNVQQTYKKLQKLGWKVIVHTSSNTYLEQDVLPYTEVVDGLEVRRYPWKWYGFQPNIDFSKGELLCLHNFDIFPHAHLLLKLGIWRTFGQAKIKLVITPHGGFTPEWKIFPFWQRVIKHTYHRTLGVWLINRLASMVRAVSEWEKKEMIGYGVRQSLIQVISNGVEDEAYGDIDRLASPKVKKQVQSFGKYLIQVGRIYQIKNYETTIRSLVELPSDIRLVILGAVQTHDTYKESLVTLATSLGVQDRVVFAGTAHGVDKYYILKHAQLMVHSALWESFCNVVHEGLSQGLVCVVADNTALSYLVQDGVHGYRVPTNDAHSYAQAVQKILKEKETAKGQKMRQENRVYGLAESWTHVAEHMHEAYRRILNGC